MSTVEYRLRRPNNDTAWGFRLQGGLDVNAPLTVQRVFNGSPADGSLQRGDVMLSINNSDVSAVYLKKAEELIKASSNTLLIVVRRIGQPVNSSRPQNDLLTQQQQSVYRPIDSSPVTPKYANPQRDSQQAPVQLSTHQQQWPQSNVWRPSAYSADSGHNDFESTSSGGDGYHSANNQWSAGAGHNNGNQLRTTNAGSRPTHHDRVLEEQPFSDNSTMSQRGTSGVGSSHAKQQQNTQPRGTVSRPQPVDEDEDDEYEPKSVRDIKQMFNSLSKSSARGPAKATTKPNFQETTFHGSAHFSTTSAPPSASTSFSNPSVLRTAPTKSQGSLQDQNPSNPYDDLYGSYPPPRQDPLSNNSMMHVSKAVRPVAAQPKPGAGYSYQGIVTVTPAKTVNNKSGNASSSGGGSTQGTKKKEFDPSRSLVFLALQEENERAKRGDVVSPDEEAPPRTHQQRQAPVAPHGGKSNIKAVPVVPTHQEQQRSSRLQELLDRDQAQSLQPNEESMSSSSPHLMTMQTRRELSPSYPGYASRGPPHWKQAQFEEHVEHRPLVSNRRNNHDQSSASPSNGYQQQQYHGGYDGPNYGGTNYSQDLPVSDF